jgi:hypothetical protein
MDQRTAGGDDACGKVHTDRVCVSTSSEWRQHLQAAARHAMSVIKSIVCESLMQMPCIYAIL